MGEHLFSKRTANPVHECAPKVRVKTMSISVYDELITHSRTSIWAAGSPRGL